MYYYHTHHITAVFTKQEQKEIAVNKSRPECGWFQLYSYYLKPQTNLTADELYYEVSDKDNYEYRLSLVEFNLAEYASSSLDLAAVKNIQTVLTQFQKTRSKVIVRFLYDWDGNGEAKEPKQLTIILKHMKTVAPLLNEYKDIIYTTQGIFVGSWGEMHDSKFLNNQDMTTLLLYYASLTDSSIYLSVRTPEQYQTIFSEWEKHKDGYKKYAITKKELTKRLGLFNDGILGSISDLGSYRDADDTTKTAQERLDARKKALSFQDTLCLHVPNGGEVIQSTDSSLSTTKDAITTLQQMHVSYLNQLYDKDAITLWKKAVYHQKNSPYDGSTLYDYITNHLGARPVLTDSSVSYHPFQKGDAKGTITVENTGFSNYYHKKDFQLICINKETKKETTLVSSDRLKNANPLYWDSRKKTVISYRFSPFSFEDGAYLLLARLSDPMTREELFFANDSYDKQYRGYVLGTLQIKR